MGLWHVLGQCGKATGFGTADMAGHPFVFKQNLNDKIGAAHIDLLFDKLIRHTVIVPVDFDMIVDIDRGLFPFGINISHKCQDIDNPSLMLKSAMTSITRRIF